MNFWTVKIAGGVALMVALSGPFAIGDSHLRPIPIHFTLLNDLTNIEFKAINQQLATQENP